MTWSFRNQETTIVVDRPGFDHLTAGIGLVAAIRTPTLLQRREHERFASVGRTANNRAVAPEVHTLNENEFADVEIDDVPVSALLHQDRKNTYGGVPGLDDKELADPEELERVVYLQEWAPILALPSP